MKMRQKVSINIIDRYYWYRSIDPSPIVPIYGGIEGGEVGDGNVRADGDGGA
jgi:hypothetical protein